MTAILAKEIEDSLLNTSSDQIKCNLTEEEEKRLLNDDAVDVLHLNEEMDAEFVSEPEEEINDFDNQEFVLVDEVGADEDIPSTGTTKHRKHLPKATISATTDESLPGNRRQQIKEQQQRRRERQRIRPSGDRVVPVAPQHKQQRISPTSSAPTAPKTSGGQSSRSNKDHRCNSAAVDLSSSLNFRHHNYYDQAQKVMDIVFRNAEESSGNWHRSSVDRQHHHTPEQTQKTGDWCHWPSPPVKQGTNHYHHQQHSYVDDKKRQVDSQKSAGLAFSGASSEEYRRSCNGAQGHYKRNGDHKYYSQEEEYDGAGGDDYQEYDEYQGYHFEKDRSHRGKRHWEGGGLIPPDLLMTQFCTKQYNSSAHQHVSSSTIQQQYAVHQQGGGRSSERTALDRPSSAHYIPAPSQLSASGKHHHNFHTAPSSTSLSLPTGGDYHRLHFHNNKFPQQQQQTYASTSDSLQHSSLSKVPAQSWKDRGSCRGYSGASGISASPSPSKKPVSSSAGRLRQPVVKKSPPGSSRRSRPTSSDRHSNSSQHKTAANSHYHSQLPPPPSLAPASAQQSSRPIKREPRSASASPRPEPHTRSIVINRRTPPPRGNTTKGVSSKQQQYPAATVSGNLLQYPKLEFPGGAAEAESIESRHQSKSRSRYAKGEITTNPLKSGDQKNFEKTVKRSEKNHYLKRKSNEISMAPTAENYELSTGVGGGATRCEDSVGKKKKKKRSEDKKPAEMVGGGAPAVVAKVAGSDYTEEERMKAFKMGVDVEYLQQYERNQEELQRRKEAILHSKERSRQEKIVTASAAPPPGPPGTRVKTAPTPALPPPSHAPEPRAPAPATGNARRHLHQLDYKTASVVENLGRNLGNQLAASEIRQALYQPPPVQHSSSNPSSSSLSGFISKNSSTLPHFRRLVQVSQLHSISGVEDIKKIVDVFGCGKFLEASTNGRDALLLFDKHEDAARFIKRFDGFEIRQRPIKVEHASS